MKHLSLFLFICFLIISTEFSWSHPISHTNDSITFPYLIDVERSGRKTYLNYITKREFNEVTDKFYTGHLGKRRWIGPEDLFLEYEVLTEDPVRENDTIPPLKNTYRCLAWILEEGQISLKIFYDKYTRGEKEWEGKTDTNWRPIASTGSSRTFSNLLDIFRKTYQPSGKKPKLSFPILFDEKENAQQTYLYDLKVVKYLHITADPYLDTVDKKRKIQKEDLFLEYEMMENMSVYTDEGIRPAGNLYRCIVCFTNNGGWNSEIYIRLLSDMWWKEGKEWHEPIDTEWRYVGYLDEIPNFQHLYNAYKAYSSILE